EVAGIDLRFVFLRAAAPHRALDLGLALERLHRFLERLVARQLAHADRLDLVGRDAERHPLLLETEYVEFELHPCDFFVLQLDHTADAVLGIDDVVADIEGGSLAGHAKSFLWPGLREAGSRSRFRRILQGCGRPS